ncbi:hypothetical protein RFI_32992 [Reticulomyxa filosa]|uniref:Uncharacterized protein n=1 Tax=Reticulomyxa filosa TaxID=46433 RepID=X6LUN1_RETFI|nr:hypothetical protein RFI_32992 [Reticulomyxa filosa]|eukprot:ETO04405.1 hypothetical protein RFI_32992 [Reticulomyxa filosa]
MKQTGSHMSMQLLNRLETVKQYTDHFKHVEFDSTFYRRSKKKEEKDEKNKLAQMSSNNDVFIGENANTHELTIVAPISSGISGHVFEVVDKNINIDSEKKDRNELNILQMLSGLNGIINEKKKKKDIVMCNDRSDQTKSLKPRIEDQTYHSSTLDNILKFFCLEVVIYLLQEAFLIFEIQNLNVMQNSFLFHLVRHCYNILIFAKFKFFKKNYI